MSDNRLTLRPMTVDDAAEVLRIYQEGIDTGHATFEERPPDFGPWFDNIHDVGRIVADQGGKLAGWTALYATSSRPVYAGVAQSSIYISQSSRGMGVGNRLMHTLIDEADAANIWSLQAGVFPENAGSMALHRGCGFRVIGRRERIGRMPYGPMAGLWRDVIWLERRSSKAGID